MSKKVCVTGASGFLGSHVVEAFLSNGYDVTAAVRNPSDRKNSFLDDLRKKYSTNGSSLRVSAGDLTIPGSHDDAVQGCPLVVHVASVVKDNYEKDPYAEIINPSVEGTRDLIATCKKHKVKRLVVTSSGSTIDNNDRKPTDPKYDETSNNTWATPTYGTYAYSKTEAEKVLYKEWDGELITIHPVLIIGPIISEASRSSVQIAIAVVNKEFGPLAPPMYFDWIDVRDCAAAHVTLAEHPTAKGRYITSRGESHCVSKWNELLGPQYPKLKLSMWKMPWAALWLASFFDRRISTAFLYNLCTPHPGFDGTKIEKEVGFKYTHTDLKKTLIDTVESLYQYNLVKVPK